MAMEASTDNEKLNLFIQQNEFYILKCASTIKHGYVSKSDDEWSIALQAFMQAIQSYNMDKGSFFPYAELVIRRRLIDYFRSQGKYKHEVYVDPYLFQTDLGDETDDMNLAVVKQVAVAKDDSIKLEIEAVNEAFSHYGFSFYDLTACSPKSRKTKSHCAKAVAYFIHNPLLIQELQTSKLLPIKIIEKNTKVPRKILERHRKYIIAAVEILSGEYPNLAEYLWYVREEISK
jgi:RNA polymerase sigma factor